VSGVTNEEVNPIISFISFLRFLFLFPDVHEPCPGRELLAMKMFRQIECCSESARSWKTVTIPMSRAACTE